MAEKNEDFKWSASIDPIETGILYTENIHPRGRMGYQEVFGIDFQHKITVMMPRPNPGPGTIFARKLVSELRRCQCDFGVLVEGESLLRQINGKIEPMPTDEGPMRTFAMWFIEERDIEPPV